MEPDLDEQRAGIGFRIGIVVLVVGIAAIAFSAIDRGGSSKPRAPADRSATLVARNLTLVEGEENALRIGFRAEGSARLIVRFTPDTARVKLCPLAAVDQPLPAASTCQPDIFSGVRQDVELPELRGIALVLGAGTAKAELTIGYSASTRAVALRLPSVPAPSSSAECRDNGCNPFVELTPASSGRLSATARWSGGEATLVLLQGRVLGRSLTATGVPYSEPARKDGAPPLSLTTSISAGAEYALAIRQHGSGALSDIRIDAAWPD